MKEGFVSKEIMERMEKYNAGSLALQQLKLLVPKLDEAVEELQRLREENEELRARPAPEVDATALIKIVLAKCWVTTREDWDGSLTEYLARALASLQVKP